jgi:hypothetical protein
MLHGAHPGDSSVMIILAKYVLTVHKRQQIVAQWSSVLQKLTFAHLVKKFPALLENEHSFLN